ncbi:MAG: mechanosensitive ion channel family protein [Gammaproteobacteria bacterium]|uniref:mechanosensitive ion channel family protein n=1 Tax=Vreelandella venusta TaxID=44935 RepID=UPI00295EA6A4|nr:mechanosensitive ion channel family protein [Halomonas venusta]MBR9924076.1 mechanosensitive ion channel family protein [Gammaproteobacteria bacterium]MDW0358421.1 mechanosensitive ion channel family protein [Halomonas venusta]MDX1355597.1 mechanosensitive ion channel family protein [Halomonas venusta]
MRQHWTINIVLGVFLTLLIGVMTFAQAQSVSLPSLGGGNDASEEQSVSSERFQSSLSDVIAMLENEEQRRALLDSLRELQLATEAGEEDKIVHQGLLGALADTLTDIGEQAQAGDSPVDEWSRQLVQGAADLRALNDGADQGEALRAVAEGAVLGVIWGTLLVVMIAFGRLIATRREWPLDLPRDPKAWLLAVHFLRRMLPWALSFAITLGIGQILPYSPGRTVVLVLAYVCVCGRALSVVIETVIAFFSRGHRFTAVQVLQQKALRGLFVIGALIALGDAVNSTRLVELLGSELSSLVSVLANMLAALLSARFIFKFKRPVRHLICNRPYKQRRDASAAVEMIRALGGLWHIPALLMVGGSLLAIFITVGDVGTALARSIISASLLVLTLVVTGLLRRQSERLGKRRHRRRYSQYRKRLERFGFVLAHLCAWMVFAELFMQVWGGSLFGLGQQAVASARIGQALISLGATVLLAWLVWIFADTAIQRALTSSARSRGRRVNQARAQTITPMIRNVIFVTILIIAVIAGLANLGVNVTPLLAGAGVIGLAIGFGAQTLVQDLITGIFILIEDSLAVDDFVQINGHMGTVEGLTLRTVKLRDLDGVVHIITFSRIESIHNMSRQFGIALMRIRIPYAMKIDDAITLMQETAQELRKDPMMRHYIWSPLEMQGVQGFEDGCPILRMRFRTAPEMQWDVSRAFNLLLKQRMEAQEIDLGVPRLSVSMEARSEDGRQDRKPDETGREEPAGKERTGTDFTLDEPGDKSWAGDSSDESGDSPRKRPAPPKPAPRPTEAELRRDERERTEASSHAKSKAQGEPKGETYASTYGQQGDE